MTDKLYKTSERFKTSCTGIADEDKALGYVVVHMHAEDAITAESLELSFPYCSVFLFAQ